MNIKHTRKTLDIFEKYGTYWLAGAEHDQIFSHFDADIISPKSDDGKALKKLGWLIESEGDCWSKYV